MKPQHTPTLEIVTATDESPWSGDIGFYPGGGTVGYYRLGPSKGSVRFGLKKKPPLLARLFVKWILDWRWVDKAEPGSGFREPTINGVPFPP